MMEPIVVVDVISETVWPRIVLYFFKLVLAFYKTDNDDNFFYREAGTVVMAI